MAEIELTQGRVALVDDCDFEWLSQWSWYCTDDGYAVRTDYSTGKRVDVRMHRLITEAEPGMDVDHINGNRSDNRRENLRICSHAENVRNRVRQANNASGFKGIHWNERSGKWQARIQEGGGTRKHLGYFDNLFDAGFAYDRTASELHGEFANLNFSIETKPDGGIIYRPQACDIFKACQVSKPLIAEFQPLGEFNYECARQSS